MQKITLNTKQSLYVLPHLIRSAGASGAVDTNVVIPVEISSRGPPEPNSSRAFLLLLGFTRLGGMQTSSEGRLCMARVWKSERVRSCPVLRSNVTKVRVTAGGSCHRSALSEASRSHRCHPTLQLSCYFLGTLCRIHPGFCLGGFSLQPSNL